MGPPAISIAAFFGNLDDEASLEAEPLPEPGPQGSELEMEPEPEPPSGPMASFDEAVVLAWLGTVPGLTAAQLTAARARMAEDEYDGGELANAKPKSLLRLLRGTAAEGAVPLLLAARDAHLAAEPAMAPGCQICFEAYGSARPSLKLKLNRYWL